MWVTWILRWRSHWYEGWVLQACLLSTPQQLWLTTFLPSTRRPGWLLSGTVTSTQHLPSCSLPHLNNPEPASILCLTDTVSSTTIGESATHLSPLARKMDSVWPPSSLPLRSFPLLTSPPPRHFLNLATTAVLRGSLLNGALSYLGSVRAFYALGPLPKLHQTF